MIKKLSAILIALSITSCACYGDLFKKSSPALVEEEVSEKPVVQESPEKIVQELDRSVFFGTNSFALSAETKKVLDAEILPVIKGRKVVVEGNCDERGSVAYNKKLGQKRADAVKAYLVKNGADSSKITTVSYGKSNPLDLAHNKKAWEVNRRAVTISTKK